MGGAVRGWRAARLLGLLTAVLLGGLQLSVTAPSWATDVRIHHSLFGVHDSSADSSSFATIGEGSVRLWDVGVRWYQVETSPRHYDWTRLDQLVAAAQAAHAQATMVVAMTPSFYAAAPTDPPRHLAAYRRFVRALMHRYRSYDGSRGIAAYQAWDEVNISTFWSGTDHEMARLTRALAHVRDKVDPQALVVGPAMVARLPFELAGISGFYAQRLGRVPVWRYVDAVSLDLYPLARYGDRAGVPEDSMRLLRQARGRLHAAGVPRSLPVWDTEVNYGLNSGARANTPALPTTPARQAANVVRTYLLNAANGVRRVFWYTYTMGTYAGGGSIANTLLTPAYEPDQLTPAGQAYALVQQWMHGTLVGSRGHRPCARDRRGTYTCVVRDSAGTRRIYWNPFHHARVRLATGAHYRQGVLGATRAVSPGATLRVGWRPVMVTG